MTQSGRIPDTHAEAWALLPFLVNGRLAAEEREWVELHVQSCDECRREIDTQRPLAQQMREAEAPFESAEQRAFAKLWTRIEASEGAIPVDEEAVRSRATGTAPRRTVRWLAAAVVIQAIGLALLGVTAFNNSEEASGEFRTVTSGEIRQTSPAVRLMFTAETSMGDVTNILAQHGLELVGGPGGSGVFTAALADTAEGTTAEAMATMLRQDPHVQFAEPVTH